MGTRAEAGAGATSQHGVLGAVGPAQHHAVRSGPRTVVVAGDPGELMLFSYGRGAARVDLRGEPAAVSAVQRSPRGL